MEIHNNQLYIEPISGTGKFYLSMPLCSVPTSKDVKKKKNTSLPLFLVNIYIFFLIPNNVKLATVPIPEQRKNRPGDSSPTGKGGLTEQVLK